MWTRLAVSAAVLVSLAGCAGDGTVLSTLENLIPSAGWDIRTPYGGGTLGGSDSRREGGTRTLYGWR
jgi:hypothetical protein